MPCSRLTIARMSKIRSSPTVDSPLMPKGYSPSKDLLCPLVRQPHCSMKPMEGRCWRRGIRSGRALFTDVGKQRRILASREWTWLGRKIWERVWSSVARQAAWPSSHDRTSRSPSMSGRSNSAKLLWKGEGRPIWTTRPGKMVSEWTGTHLLRRIRASVESEVLHYCCHITSHHITALTIYSL